MSRHPIAAGEALFSDAEARLLDRHGGLRRAHGVLVFDPVHCYGLPGHLRILDALAAGGWPRHAFWPHGSTCSRCTWWQPWGWGAEVNPLAFAPFRGAADGSCFDAGMATLPQAPGIGFEEHGEAWGVMQRVFGGYSAGIRRGGLRQGGQGKAAAAPAGAPIRALPPWLLVGQRAASHKYDL